MGAEQPQFERAGCIENNISPSSTHVDESMPIPQFTSVKWWNGNTVEAVDAEYFLKQFIGKPINCRVFIREDSTTFGFSFLSLKWTIRRW
jgi:hypothetical protein